MCNRAWLLVIWVTVAAALGAGRAPAEGPTAVVVLPFASADEELAIYGKPVADAVATKLGSLQGFHVVAAGVEGAAARGDLVVELRVTRERRKVRLEATVRDPDVGDTLGGVASRPVKLAAIDAAATDLSRRLAARLDA